MNCASKAVLSYQEKKTCTYSNTPHADPVVLFSCFGLCRILLVWATYVRQFHLQCSHHAAVVVCLTRGRISRLHCLWQIEMNMAAQNEVTTACHALLLRLPLCFDACQHKHTHNFAMTILFPSTFGLRDLSSRSRFILQINMHIIILQLLKQCPDCIGCPSLPQHHPLVPGPNVAVYQQRIQIQLLRKQRKECNFASGSLESCDWMRFKENKRTTKTQKLSYRQSLLTAALDSSSTISWHIDLSLEMNSDRLCVYNNYIYNDIYIYICNYIYIYIIIIIYFIYIKLLSQGCNQTIFVSTAE